MARSKQVKVSQVQDIFVNNQLSKAELIKHLTDLGSSASPQQRRTALKVICQDFNIDSVLIDNLVQKTDNELVTLGNVCILLSKGHDLSKIYEQSVLKQKLETLLSKNAGIIEETTVLEKPKKIKTISNSLTDWLNSCDETLDNFICGKSQQLIVPVLQVDSKVDQKYLQDVMLLEWSTELERLSTEENREYYSNFSTKQFNTLKKFYSSLIELISNQTPIKVIRKPRKTIKKNKPVEKQLEKIQVNTAAKVSAKDMLNATEIWAYHETYQSVIHLVAEEGKTFTIKGKTLQNVDLSKSGRKRIRPNRIQQTLTEFEKANKNRCGLIFTAIKSKTGPASPRLSSAITLIHCF